MGSLFVKPTVVVADPTKTIVREEVFGPVPAACTFNDEDDAIALANDTPYGLAGAVWTKDVHRAHRVAGAIRAGTVGINADRVVPRTHRSAASACPASVGRMAAMQSTSTSKPSRCSLN